MKENFLYIHHIPTLTNSRLSELAAYYNSGPLVEDITTLINERLNRQIVMNKVVLLKPNWVKHSTTFEDELCLRTNNDFLLSTLKAIMRMSPTRILLGDAPVQGANWSRILPETMLKDIARLSLEYNIPVQIIDFRRRIYKISENKPNSEIRPLSKYVIFDLGRFSALEPVTHPEQQKFRVTNYDPDIMSSAHSPGVHKYCIAREFFEADIIISLPKIKTHQKTGITGALKNIVGINGDKDFLPHHRIGGDKTGGDCYPGGSFLRHLSELSLDNANRRQGKKSFWYWQKLSSLLWILSFPGKEHSLSAGWHGNDTTWRMVTDINYIAEFGTKDGHLSKYSQRQLFSLCDAVIAGQGEGPLNPKPLPLGIISFTNCSLLNDRAMAILMNLPLDIIPLLTNSTTDFADSNITIDGKAIYLEDLKPFSVTASLPKGWGVQSKKIK